MHKSIGLLEFRSIAKGIESADAMVKTAPVDLIIAGTLCPGKYIAVVSGEVAAVESAVRAGAALGREELVDELVIANVHPDIFPALTASTDINLNEIQSVGIIETFSIAASVAAADLAAKAANVKLIEVRLARGLGGKSFVCLAGTVAEVRAAVEAGSQYAKDQGLLVSSVVIPSAHPSLLEKLL
ncbi:MAG: BMC domain-containing protein [bacterium]|nr:BMC domain-containing protein [bacterium]